AAATLTRKLRNQTGSNPYPLSAWARSAGDPRRGDERNDGNNGEGTFDGGDPDRDGRRRAGRDPPDPGPGAGAGARPAQRSGGRRAGSSPGPARAPAGGLAAGAARRRRPMERTARAALRERTAGPVRDRGRALPAAVARSGHRSVG